jgi:hypothetical protein
VRLLFGRTVRHIYAELVLGRGRLFVSESRAGGTPTGDLSELWPVVKIQIIMALGSVLRNDEIEVAANCIHKMSGEEALEGEVARQYR